MEVMTIVTTFGAQNWRGRGARTALLMNAHHFHDERDPAEISLGGARNAAVREFDPQEWICFLDADDELGTNYFKAMPDNPSPHQLLMPTLHHPKRNRPGVYTCVPTHDRDIMIRNPAPIGTLIHRTMFEDAGRFWAEPAWEDWSLFNDRVNVADMIEILQVDPTLAQVALKRQPWNPAEEAAGGFMELHPDDFVDRWVDFHTERCSLHWVVQERFFTTNPSLYRSGLLQRYEWPKGENSEGRFTAQLRGDGWRFGYLGATTDPPLVHHIGDNRVGTGY